MTVFFLFLKKAVVLGLLVVVGFVATYTPQLPSNNVQPVQAGGGLGAGATEFTQLANNTLLGSNLAQNTITAVSTAGSWLNDNVLDGLGWAIAKRIMSGMIRSLINWVNSGFQGRPAFIQDFTGFLTDIADQEIGNLISQIGGDSGIGSFICSPFKLDVQIAIETQYQRGRAGGSAPACRLSGIVSNIQGFIDGVDTSGGIRDWLTITATPQTYTPYGAVLTAEGQARARIINAQGQEVDLLKFGGGFLSQRVCEPLQGVTGTKNCSIVKPGQVIAAQINKALGAGQDTLVEADEVNELISALLAQLANKALSGVSGLLGLSDPGGGRSGGSSSFLDDLYNDSGRATVSGTDTDNIISRSLEIERDFVARAEALRTGYVLFIANSTNSTNRNRAQTALADIERRLADSRLLITELEVLEIRYQTPDESEQIEVLIEYSNLSSQTKSQADSRIENWTRTADDLGIVVPATALGATPLRLTNSIDPYREQATTTTLEAGPNVPPPLRPANDSRN
jgi:hypothetical protein